jgi:hypothetical protein
MKRVLMLACLAVVACGPNAEDSFNAGKVNEWATNKCKDLGLQFTGKVFPLTANASTQAASCYSVDGTRAEVVLIPSRP